MKIRFSAREPFLTTLPLLPFETQFPSRSQTVSVGQLKGKRVKIPSTAKMRCCKDLPMGITKKKGSQQRTKQPTTMPSVLAAFFSRENLRSLTEK